MKTTQFKNIYQVTFSPGLFPINCYVIERENDLVVVDMGLKGFIKAVKKIQEASSKPVSLLLLTHAHSDHVNGVGKFQKDFKEVKTGISERDERLLQGDFKSREGESQNKIRGGFSKDDINVDFTFNDGDVFGNIEVLYTPGHTPGSVTFYLSDSQSVIVGDAFQTKGGTAVAGYKNLTFPFPAFATWDAHTALKSAYKILEVNPQMLFCGHGAPLKAPKEEISQAIQQMEEKLS